MIDTVLDIELDQEKQKESQFYVKDCISITHSFILILGALGSWTQSALWASGTRVFDSDGVSTSKAPLIIKECAWISFFLIFRSLVVLD